MTNNKIMKKINEKEIRFKAKIEIDGEIKEYPVGLFNGNIIISTHIPYYGLTLVPLTEEFGKLIEVYSFEVSNE